VTGVPLQDFTENELRLLSVVGHERSGCLLDERSLRISQSSALIGDCSIRMLSKVNEDITIGKPRAVMMWRLFQDTPHFFACPGSSIGAPICACEVNASICEIRSRGDDPLEGNYALAHPVLIEQRSADQPEAIHFPGELGLERAQPALCGSRPAGSQSRVRETEIIVECGFWAGRVHDIRHTPAPSVACNSTLLEASPQSRRPQLHLARKCAT
jgi:hypothetical protein